MPEIRLPTVSTLDPIESCVWIAPVQGQETQLVSKRWHDAWVEDLRALYTADIDWARKVCAEHGINLDELADHDPNYRTGFRLPT